MTITSLSFFLALFPVAVLFYCVPLKLRAPYLLVASLAFYALAGPVYLILLVLAASGIYVCARKIAASKNESAKNTYLFLSVGLIVALIIGFKAAGAFKGIILPLGLSYYSFKLISYVVEVYWDEEALEKDFLCFALYVSFFPQIVSGPIQRPAAFFEQIRIAISGSANYAQIEAGFNLILKGLMLKLLIGDRLGAFIADVDVSPLQFKWTVILTLVFCYTLQLYADFSGYTNIAIGVGKLFGIDAPPNFDAPFSAANLQLMWQRWHMSLTSWLTDYLFTPLNMALRGMGQLGLALAIAVNMIAIGLWHGFTLNFLAFGICQAIFSVIIVFTRRWRDRLFGKHALARRFRNISGAILTFILMTFTLIFFHSSSWEATQLHLKLLFGITHAGSFGFDAIRADEMEPVFVCMALSYYFSIGAPGTSTINRHLCNIFPNWMRFGFNLLVISALTLDTGVPFIYGQF